MAGPRVIVVVKKSSYQAYLEEGKDPRVEALLRRGDPTVRRWKRAHEDHMRTVERVEATLEHIGARSWLICDPQTAFDARDAALVVTVGGDGTLLAASHHVGDTRIVGVNSAPKHSIGFFCAARSSNVGQLLKQALAGELPATKLTRMKVEVDGRRISNRVLNEALFCHRIPAATSRYILRYAGQREEQRSSGVWVGTAAGSTGAQRSAGGKVLPLLSQSLQVVVREPYVGERGSYRMTRFEVLARRQAVIQNKMRHACLFLDGPHRCVGIAIGQSLRFVTSNEPLFVLGLDGKRSRSTVEA